MQFFIKNHTRFVLIFYLILYACVQDKLIQIIIVLMKQWKISHTHMRQISISLVQQNHSLIINLKNGKQNDFSCVIRKMTEMQEYSKFMLKYIKMVKCQILDVGVKSWHILHLKPASFRLSMSRDNIVTLTHTHTCVCMCICCHIEILCICQNYN